MSTDQDTAYAALSRRKLPGDWIRSPRQHLEAALRINHAGEYGAQRIYAGQMAVLRHHPVAPVLAEMAAQEQAHLRSFEQLLPQQRVRPSALLPLWHVGGYLLGAASAALGVRAAMACTVAVESVITEHYDRQLASEYLPPPLRPTIAAFRDDEQAHHDLGLAHDAQSAPAYPLLHRGIEAICRLAIRLSARI